MIMTAAELKAQRWVSIIMECKTSGLSVSQWCNEHGINEKQYWYYHRKLRNYLAQEVGNHMDVLPVTLPPSSDVTFQELKKPIRHGSAHIQLGNHTSTEACRTMAKQYRYPITGVIYHMGQICQCRTVI